MAFKARPPPTLSPSTSDYHQFSDWRKEFEIYMAVTTFFGTEVNLPVQRARLFNLAGQDFSKFVHQHMTVGAETTIAQLLDGVGNSLKPKRYDLQNREQLFAHRQSQNSAAKFLDELWHLYDLSNYGANITQNQLIQDLFISGIESKEARCLIYQQNSETLTIDQCLHLVSSFESVNSGNSAFAPPSGEVTVNSVNTS